MIIHRSLEVIDLNVFQEGAILVSVKTKNNDIPDQAIIDFLQEEFKENFEHLFILDHSLYKKKTLFIFTIFCIGCYVIDYSNKGIMRFRQEKTRNGEVDQQPYFYTPSGFVYLE